MLMPTATMDNALERIALRMCMPLGYGKMGNPIRICMCEEEVDAFSQAAVYLKVAKKISSVIQTEPSGAKVLVILPFGVHLLGNLLVSS